MRRRTTRDPLIGSELEVAVRRLGAGGDGIAETPAGPLYFTGAAPGDRVLARRTRRRGDGYAAAMVQLLHTGAQRRRPPCPYYDRCGGCVAQHLDNATYADWKRGLVLDALARRGLPTGTVAPLQEIPAGSRRRAEFHAFAAGNGIRLGFHGPGTREVVDIDACLVLRPGLQAVIPALRAALGDMLTPGTHADILVTETPTGLDILITGTRRPGVSASLAAFAPASLAAFAASRGVARISWRRRANVAPEPSVQFAQPTAEVAGVPVALPAGTFQQASAAAEAALAAFVAQRLPSPGRIADLYAGIGTFSLPLARAGHRVHAVDADTAALTALQTAAGGAGLGGRLTVEPRDLDQRPLQTEELHRFGAVIFDPPRAGARAQVAVLAAAGPRRVIGISCEPGTFARDAARLVAGGYRLVEVRPIDQFVYSSKIELAALFERPA